MSISRFESIVSAVSSPSPVIVMPALVSMSFESAITLGVTACGLMKQKACCAFASRSFSCCCL